MRVFLRFFSVYSHPPLQVANLGREFSFIFVAQFQLTLYYSHPVIILKDYTSILQELIRIISLRRRMNDQEQVRLY